MPQTYPGQQAASTQTVQNRVQTINCTTRSIYSYWRNDGSSSASIANSKTFPGADVFCDHNFVLTTIN
ncbi:hypothetical protein DPMN_083812 [Dreissena polymorpha]|uniref:Uncharacterized protein n=1 Tax=Dreissena polymorpha TaxID=45954 RepID=A0A9D3Y9M6_DREPO|nr:hypothetical protein DPMN_083812 [Dreissena polymorpha]